MCYEGSVAENKIVEVSTPEICTEMSQILMVDLDHDYKWGSNQFWHTYVLGINKNVENSQYSTEATVVQEFRKTDNAPIEFN